MMRIGSTLDIALAQIRPKLVQLDLQMPELGGFAFHKLLARPERASLPVVVVTAKDRIREYREPLKG